MPLFEYHCNQCHAEFEHLVRGADEGVSCPQCGGRRVEKLISVPARPASSSGGSSLPLSQSAPMSGGCGLPQCGQGYCAMDD